MSAQTAGELDEQSPWRFIRLLIAGISNSASRCALAPDNARRDLLNHLGVNVQPENVRRTASWASAYKCSRYLLLP